MPKLKFDPIKVRGGWLYWDVKVTSIRSRRDKGKFTVTVTGERTGRVVVERDEQPLAAFLRAMVRLADQCAKPAGEVV